MLTHEELWLVFKKFLEERGLTRQQLDSFNDFVTNGLQQIIDEVGELPIEIPGRPYKIKFGKIEVGRPQKKETFVGDVPEDLYPMEARLRNMTYAAPIYLEMAKVREGEEDRAVYERVHIGDLPIMVKSIKCLLYGMSEDELIEHGEDPRDPGGYFIINGSERVIVAIEDLAPNRILVDIDKTGTHPVYKAKTFSTTIGFKARIEVLMKSNGSLYVVTPGIPAEIPFVIMMRALGVESDQEIANMVSLSKEIQDMLEPSFEEASSVLTVEEAVLHIGNKVAFGKVKEYRLKRAEMVIDKNLLPHIGRTPDKRREKAVFLAEMARRVIELRLGKRKPDDKDHYANKRLRLAGALLADLFRIAFKSLCKDIKYQLEKTSMRKHEPEKLAFAVRHSIITERLQHAMATGNWGLGKVGVTQLLDRTNYLSSLSHLRRLQSPLSRSQPNFEARDLHPTQWGRLCPNETPEGSNCGLVKNLALSATISVGVDARSVIRLLHNLGVVPTDRATDDLRLRGAKVIVDGHIIGYVEDPYRLVREIRRMRRHGLISYEVNVACREEGEEKEVVVNCDAGRVRRPLIIVENGVPKLKKSHIQQLASGEIKLSDLLVQGVIEYLDADEEEDAYIAVYEHELTPEHTHLEITPYAILGVTASIIPYAQHNQSPRNSYEAAMAKQALGLPILNAAKGIYSSMHLLCYPQKPLVTTKSIELIGYDKRPAGQNCVVAVLSYQGYNMEDALVFNKASIERGLARSIIYKLYEAECRQYPGGEKEKFEIPSSDTRGYRGEKAYRLLENDGIVGLGTVVGGGDILIGRTSPPRFLEEYKEFEAGGLLRRESSVGTNPTEKGIVDAVIITESQQGNRLVKVVLRDHRIPEIGDKFASRHGQKGVIGLIVPEEDMPFTESGIVPDLIINPHAIPSRMTIGQYVESMAGKVAAIYGKPVDGTPFVGTKYEEIMRLLKEAGFHYGGREVMYDGIRGRKYVADIFIGVVYYQKLHHMVADKMHARARGQVQMLTRQPTEGRARGGGLRFGEMERDCLIGHGATMLLIDRLLEESDKYIAHVCEKCGLLAYYDLRQRKYMCKLCGDKAKVHPVVMSYAFKLLLQELMSLCIAPRLQLKGKI